MCIICAQYELGKLTKQEAVSNLLEIIVTEEPSHEAEALAEILWYDDEESNE